jgi:hypothetical protein
MGMIKLFPLGWRYISAADLRVGVTARCDRHMHVASAVWIQAIKCTRCHELMCLRTLDEATRRHLAGVDSEDR